ncbi:MAG: aldehyde dehydrogenase [Flavobacteriales bacterium]|nr:aldehyde dehydrogenase [Flavobacteriales bacterium]
MSVVDQLGNISGSYVSDKGLVKSSGELFDVINSANEEVIGKYADCTEQEVLNVIATSNQVQKEWKKTDHLHRSELLHEAARRMREIQPEMAELLTRESGKPYKEAFDEVSWSITAMDYYAEVARHENGKVLGPAVEGQLHYTIKEPLGVVALIMPYNFPFCLFVWSAAAALASGNSVILKPSELTSLSSLKMLEVFDCLPKGLVQCVTGHGRVGAQLVGSKDTHMVGFTGSVPTGKIVASECAKLFKRCTIEASGNDPFIVMPSAPLDIAARGGAFAANIHCGQVCTSAERFYVHKDIHDEYVEKLIAEVSKLRVGNGLDKVDIGPMVSKKELDRYEAIIANAISQGATVAYGGGKPEGTDKGWWTQPIVLTGVTQDMDIMHNESFGPVAPICKVESFDQAIEFANQSEFGLGGTVYTTDLKEALRGVNEIESGMIWINAPLLDNDAGPFGGQKYSGMGRQLGSEGLDTFRHTKLAMIDPNVSEQDFWWFPYKDAEAYSGDK